MVRHQFVERNDQFLQYRLIFDIRCTVHVSLRAPTFFDFQAKGRYFITREEATEYERRAETARLQAAAHQAIAAPSQYDPNYYFGYPPGQPRPQTNLGQKPKLGEYVFLTDITFMFTHLFQLSVLILFHCIIHASLISFSSFLLVCLINLKKKQKNSCSFQLVYFPCMQWQ